MKIIGLVGGVASGKSTVASAFAKLGAVVLDADKLAHEKLDEPAVQEVLLARWGDGILSPDGTTNRSMIAEKVFDEDAQATENRKFLERLLHPLIRRRVEREITTLKTSAVPAVVIDAPLLIEAGWQEICDAVIFIDTPEATRRSRAEDRGWSQQEFARRESAQMPIGEKRAKATHTLDNRGTPGDLTHEVAQLWSQIVGSG